MVLRKDTGLELDTTQGTGGESQFIEDSEGGVEGEGHRGSIVKGPSCLIFSLWWLVSSFLRVQQNLLFCGCCRKA